MVYYGFLFARPFCYNTIMEGNNPILFKSLESIMNVLNCHKLFLQDNSNVVELLNIYQSKKELGNAAESKKFPFIVLEGLDGCGKTTLSRALSKKRGAELMCTPPKSIDHLRSSFDDATLRTAFYSLGNYIAAEEIRVITARSPVMLDRYWHSTGAFALAQAVHNKEIELPPIDDEVYKWPTDLLKPDLVIYLDVSEENRLERISRRPTCTDQESLIKTNADFRKNIITAYERMIDPKIEKVDSNLTFNMTLSKLFDATNHLFVR
ncbi:UMP-CMP kinase 2, mitochondrial-like isoform X2 [Chrysoperla carnea]|uniref:UMP-CMP kinase 2, mitochondrial-like isoform X2 n=1 Tax=Chrysoperla carnea TaxID=189513 RepID=UPI001D08CA2C|nr:UMP-CMP kinase 2, mitochondrial-like isoform X2 [Chrysoperla carnea]